MALASCTSRKELLFANRNWHISDYYGRVVDRDSLLQFSLGDGLIDKSTPLIGCKDSVAAGSRFHNYISDILRLSGLENATILVYAPVMGTMFVILPEGYTDVKPNSISVKILDERPCTSWVRDDDNEIWERQHDQMYTNIYKDKRHKLLVIVDKFNYGTLPIARIQIIQSWTKQFAKRFPHEEASSVWADIDKAEHLEALSYWIDSHRKISFDNYRIGVENKISNQ